MQKICLDTCAFFFSIRYNEIYKNGGMEALDALLKQDEEQIKDYEEKLRSAIPPEFLEKHKNLSFEDQLDLFKDYAEQIKQESEGNIEKYKKNAQGIFYNDGKEIHIPISEQKRQKFLNLIEDQKEKLEKVLKYDKAFIDAKEDYKLLLRKRQMGLVYKGMLEGKYEFYITPTVLAEIFNHSAEEDSYSEKGKVKFDKEKIDALLEICTLLSMDDKEIKDKIDELAAAFRTSLGSDTKEMAPDKNSLGMYGDSMIMAEACIAGMILITLNLKDFIDDKSFKQANDRIRRHIAKVESGCSYATDALAYSPVELLAGEAKEPTKQPYYEVLDNQQDYDKEAE